MRKHYPWWPIPIIVVVLGLFLAGLCLTGTASAGGGTIYRGISVEFGQPTHLPVNSSTVYLSRITIDSSLTERIGVHKPGVNGSGGLDMEVLHYMNKPDTFWFPIFPSTYMEGFAFFVEGNEHIYAEILWNKFTGCFGPRVSILQSGETVRVTASLGLGAEQVLYVQPIAGGGTIQTLDKSSSFSLTSPSGAFFLMTKPVVEGKFSSNDVCATIAWDNPNVTTVTPVNKIFLPLTARKG